MSEFYIYYHIKTLIYQSVLIDSKDCDVLSTRRGILCAGAVKFMLRWHLYPLLCSSVPPTARCHQQLLLRNCTEHWQRVLPLPAPPAADIHIAHCVPSVVVSNGGEWHWNKNKDVVMLPSCREVWCWSPKGVKKKFRRTQYSKKASNSKHNISNIYTRLM